MSVANSVPLRRNSTLVSVAPVTDAVALIVTDAGATNVALFAGLPMLTTGVAFVRDVPHLRRVARVDGHLVVIDAAAIAERVGERHGQRVRAGVDHAVELGLDDPAVIALPHAAVANLPRQLHFGAHRRHERIRPGAPDGTTAGVQIQGNASPGESRLDHGRVGGHRKPHPAASSAHAGGCAHRGRRPARQRQEWSRSTRRHCRSAARRSPAGHPGQGRPASRRRPRR